MITFVSIFAILWFLRAAGLAWECVREEEGAVSIFFFGVFAATAVVSGLIVAFAIKVNS